MALTSTNIQHLWDKLEHSLWTQPYTHHHCPTLLMLLWLNGSKSLQPGNHSLVESLSMRVEADVTMY